MAKCCLNVGATSMSQEKQVRVANGWVMLVFNVALALAGAGVVAWGVYQAVLAEQARESPAAAVCTIVAGVVVGVVGSLLMAGLFTLQPNEACVLLLFGSYVGSVRDSGFW